MATRSGSKPKTARLLANVPAPAVNEISLLDRLSILASILLSLEQSATASAAEPSSPGEQAGGEPATSDTSAAVDGAANLPATVEIARIADDPSTHSQTEDTGKSTPSVEPHLAQAGPDPNLLIVPPPAEAAIKPIAPHGSSTSPTLLRIEAVDDKVGSAPLSLEKLVVATPLSDVIVSPIPATTFAFNGAAGPQNFDVFIGTGHGNAVDFSGLTGLVKPQQGPADATIKHDTSAPNGVFVDLTAQAQTVETANGLVTVQAWQLDADGKAVMPLAHLENIDNVTGTVGNDIVVGNANANTFTYTAADGSKTGESASYGFDIYYGGPRAGVAASDLGDRVDFSKLGTLESAAAAGMDQVLLPYDAKGISIDLAQWLTIASIDPETGETTTVKGSLVSTIGGSEQMDLALLAWTAVPDGEAHGTIEQIVGSGGSDVILGDAADNTFIAVASGENGASVFDGRAGNDAVDFRHISLPDAMATGVYVNLSSSDQSAESSEGSVTVQAWTIGAEGTVGTALMHIENVETVIGTVGSDIVVGDEHANTFVYTAADDARIDAAGAIATGPGASYGFDIYYGADGAGSNASDSDDTADFSSLGSQASVAAALAEGIDSTLLPHGATGITVDLAQAAGVTTVNPETGERTVVTGSVVSTIGGSEHSDLALLAWSAPQDGGAGKSTIENVVSSGGADAIWGNAADNSIVVTATGDNGPVFFDGRGGNDTVDFSKLGLSGSNTGIEIHLNQTDDVVTAATGAVQSDVVQASLLSQDQDNGAPVAQLVSVENVIGSRGDDVIEGDSKDNVLAGGGGSDTFVFGDVAVVDGRGVTDIGHDIIRDFRQGGLTDDDQLVFDSRIFNFHDGSSLDWLQQLLTNNQIRDDDQGVIIWIDDNNSVTLQNYDLDDHSGHAAGLSAYASWIVFV